ncbi:MAG: VWA domain-containing protein [Thermoanaerobaculia bacterium]
MPVIAAAQEAASVSTLAVMTPEQRDAAVAELAPRYRQWLQSVRGLISLSEADYFLRLREDFRRDAFMEAFWEPRDPDRQTSKNELRERWQEHRGASGDVPYGDARFLLLLFNGPPTGWTLPDGRRVGRCFARSTELEIWYYDGSERTDKRFAVIFQQTAVNHPYQVYHLGGNLRPIQRSKLPTTNINLLCADELLRYTVSEIVRLGGELVLDRVLSPPLPSPEWLANFKASATDLPDGAVTFDVDAVLSFPARNQSRTAVRLMIAVATAEVPGRRFDGELFHSLELVGEVIRKGRLFEGFRYRFEGPTPDGATTVPIGFTRYLRPGPLSLRVLVKDVYGGRFAQVIRDIEVPSPEGLEPVETTVTALERPAETLRLYAPPGDLHVGKMRFTARTRQELEKVTFYLDDRPVFSKRSPPFSVELDLGDTLQPHRVRVVGIAGGREVATDQVWLNQGAQRFRVRLVEPRAGGIYPGSVTARVEVETPDGTPPERIELFLNDERVASFSEPPLHRSLQLADSAVAVVRAVAYLTDGSIAEDAVVINASSFVDEVDVRLVELFALVTDRDGRPLRGLEQERFRVREDGVEQRIRRFEEASAVPIQAALLIDRSASMEPHLARVSEAALSFVKAAAGAPEDRVAVLSFADRVSVDAGFGAAAGQAERALAGLGARGGTALYDSLIQAFNTFEGLSGPSAMLLFSDGQDESSRLTLEQTLETARRAGVTLYSVGLAEAFPDKASRRVLKDLAEETGGEAFFLAGLDELDGVYATILEQLRARYLIAYQSSSGKTDSEYRSVEVEVDVKGAEVRARRGYYP